MTRPLRAIVSVTLSAALVCAATGVLRAQAPNAANAAASALFADAVAKESAVRKALAGDVAVPSVLRAVRTVVADYEAVVRRYPSSGFSDDALWRAAKLSREAFDAFHESREKTAAVRLLRQLAAGYPSSRFSPLTAAEMSWLNTNQSVVPAASSGKQISAPPQRALAAEPVPVAKAEVDLPRPTDSVPQAVEPLPRVSAAAALANEAPRLSETTAAKPPAGLVSVRAVRRTVLPTVVRVVVELDAEVSYRDDRLENPTRVFVDIPSTRANMALIDQTMRFDGDADIVRQIRIGRHPNNVTRIVLEGAGISSYSIYPLYNPYRLVIDCIRTASEAKADSPLQPPAATVSLPPAPVVPATASAEPAQAAPVAVPPKADKRPPVAPAPVEAQVVAAAPVTAPVPADTDKPAWVETLRRKPGGAARTAPAALPPIPSPSLRSKAVSGTVPLPSAEAVAVPAPIEPPVVKPMVSPKQPTASREADAASAKAPPAEMAAPPEPALVARAETAATGTAAAATVAAVPALAASPAPAAPPPTVTATTPAGAATVSTVSADSTVPAANTVAAIPVVAPAIVAEPLEEDIDSELPPLATRPASGAASRSPKANVAGGLSMARQLGLGASRIVIDAGHGGHDPGAQGHGVSEADLVLDVALRLEKLLAKVPGVEVLLTRRTDVFIPLQERTVIANREGADLFLSIHANASNTPSAQGIETYFLNFASNRSAAAVAARENATSGQTMGELQDVVKAIAANNKRDESRDFATYVQRELMNSLKKTDKTARNLGVKQAPFVVLVGAAMPSILAEISFITNPQEAKLLKQNSYRQRIAQALFEGVRRYQSSLKSPLAVAQQQN